MTIPLHEIKLEGEDEFAQKFNHSSDLWQRAHDLSLTEQEREGAFKAWHQDRMRMEMGL